MSNHIFVGRTAILAFSLFVSNFVFSQDETITYDTHVAAILRSKCGTCHGDGKQEAGLSLTSYEAIIKGSGSGPIAMAGRSRESRLIEVIRSDDASVRMPPEGERLTENQIATVSKWIDSGMRENAGSTAAQMRTLGFKPMASSAMDSKGALPSGLPELNKSETRRPFPRLGLAASSRAPVLAASSYKAIDLIDPLTDKLLGAVPFAEGEPLVLRFSAGGRILLAGGGKPVQSGSVVLFDVASGKRLASVADEPDAIMAADISPDERFVAVGCTSRLVKIYSTQDGSLVSTINKHTDWITSVAYSPDGKYLATADRIGNIYLWDGYSSGALLSFAAHKKSIRSLAWRSDSLMVASAGEDGLVVWWDVKDGWPVVQKADAHTGGVLDACFGPKGELATCGRDGSVRIWSDEGNEIKRFSTDDQSRMRQLGSSEGNPPGIRHLILRVAIINDGTMVIAGDNLGHLHRWKTSD
ncbi:MAG: c-type cytochrome domain-containing protein [Pirellula sp.]